jgi:hypothetical protein
MYHKLREVSVKLTPQLNHLDTGATVPQPDLFSLFPLGVLPHRHHVTTQLLEYPIRFHR